MSHPNNVQHSRDFRKRRTERIKRMEEALNKIAFLCDADLVGAQRLNRDEVHRIALCGLPD